MNAEHRKGGYPEEWRAEIYSASSIANGCTAITSGLVAQKLEDSMGQIGPFKGAVVLTVLSLALIWRWPENYGSSDSDDGVLAQLKKGWKAVSSSKSLMKVGAVQSFSEGAMYTFVFMWVPTLMGVAPNGSVPTGAVFSSLMIAIR